MGIPHVHLNIPAMAAAAEQAASFGQQGNARSRLMNADGVWIGGDDGAEVALAGGEGDDGGHERRAGTALVDEDRGVGARCSHGSSDNPGWDQHSIQERRDQSTSHGALF